MKILGVIPARGGSKGVKDKNLFPIAGKSLICYTIEAALSSGLHKVIVSTDSDKIADVARSSGVEVPFRRPDDLATDTAKSLDVAMHALKTMEQLDKTKYDALMLLQPTAPFRKKEHIDRAISLLRNNPDASSVISVVDVLAHHPARMKYIEDGWLIDPPFCEAYENQNRQELRPMYIRNGAIYLTRRDTLLQHSYKGAKSLALVMTPEASVNIDNLRDFEFAEWTYQKYFS
jgi:CMP-N,N'-diacetyllegionaminic acid synthase